VSTTLAHRTGTRTVPEASAATAPWAPGVTTTERGPRACGPAQGRGPGHPFVSPARGCAAGAAPTTPWNSAQETLCSSPPKPPASVRWPGSSPGSWGPGRVIASTGSQERAERLRTVLGYDDVVVRGAEPLAEQLAKAAPDGIDAYFDHVCGEQLRADAARPRPPVRSHGRAVRASGLQGEEALAVRDSYTWIASP